MSLNLPLLRSIPYSTAAERIFWQKKNQLAITPSSLSHAIAFRVNSLACLSRLVTIWPFWPPSDLGPPPWLQPRHPPSSPLPVFADSVSSGLASPPQPLLLVVQDSVVRTVPVAPADTTPLLPPGLVGAPPPYSLSTLGFLLSVALLTCHYHR